MKKKALQEYPIKMFGQQALEKLENDSKIPVVAAEIVQLKKEKVLMLSVYKPEKLRQGDMAPSYRVFQSETDYGVQDLETKKWRGCSWQHFIYGSRIWAYYRDHKEYKILDSESEKIILNYYGEEAKKDSVLALVYAAEKRMMEQRTERKNQRQQEKTNQKMALVSPTDEIFRHWAEEEGLYWSRFIFYEYSRKKKLRGWCTHCKQEVILEKGIPRHNKSGICPSCNSPVTFIASGRKPQQMYHFSNVSKLEKVDGRILYREFFVSKDYRGITPDSWTFRCTESLRMFLDEDGKVTSYRRNVWDRSRNEWYWSKARRTHKTMLYPEGIPAVLSDTPYRYSALFDYLKNNLRESFYPVNYLKVYLEYPGMEYFVKAGLYKIVFGFMEYPHMTGTLEQGKDIKTALGIASVQEWELARSNSVELWEFRMMQNFLHHGVKLTNPELRSFLRLYNLNTYILEVNQYLPLRKWASYMAKQVDVLSACKGHRLDQEITLLNHSVWKAHQDTYKLWEDYVRISKSLGYELKSETVLCPHNLMKEHDRVSEEYQKMQDKKERAKLRRQDRKVKPKLEVEKKLLNDKIKNEKFQLVVPKSGADIRREGRKLGHCVRTYVDFILSGKCQIYFIRKVEALEEPYYTVEWRDGKIVQCRGKKNCGYNSEMGQFLKLAERKIRKIKKMEQMPEKAA